MRQTLSEWSSVRKPVPWAFFHMLVGYMRVSADSDRQVLDLQRDALVAAGVDERHLYEDRVSGGACGSSRSDQGASIHQIRRLPSCLETGLAVAIAAASARHGH